MSKFQLVSPFPPAGDQPQAIESLVDGLNRGKTHQTLLGVTGSGKTFTMANVIAQYGRPALVMSHNKTLAAQLYAEFKDFFPHNAVRYFVSYYDYYQPEAYIPQRDIYIEKDAAINDEIERLRLACTSALVSRPDVIVVASVSCIYGLGSPDDYRKMMVRLQLGDIIDRDEMLRKFVDIQYDRNDVSFERGKFRVRGDVVELWPAYEEIGFRIELFGDEVERLATIDPVSGSVLETHQDMYVYPAKHFVLPEERIKGAVEAIGEELEQRLKEMKEQGKLLEAQRLGARTRYDMEMLLEVGYCSGIENYSRPLSGRKPGETPSTLLDFFPADSLIILDESHVTVPQIRGMFAGDFSRKSTLVEHGFRLPSALDNRPLRFDEWEKKFERRLFVSATPGDYEAAMTGGEVVEQVIRPTGLVDPIVRVEPARGQVPALLKEIKARAAKGERGADHHPHQAVGRGPVPLPQGAGPALQVAALGARRLRTGQHPPRAARRGLRCPGGRQPAARRARLTRGLDGLHPRRRQGGLPPERDLAHSNHRPIGPARQRRGGALRRQDHQLDAARHRRDQPPAHLATGVQQGTWHHARDDQESDPPRHRGANPGQGHRAQGRRPRRGHRRHRGVPRRSRGRDARGRREAGVQTRRRPPRQDPRAPLGAGRWAPPAPPPRPRPRELALAQRPGPAGVVSDERASTVNRPVASTVNRPVGVPASAGLFSA